VLEELFRDEASEEKIVKLSRHRSCHIIQNKRQMRPKMQTALSS